MIRILSDSTCDLSKELLERYHIRILPLHVNLGTEGYLDGVTITPDEIYKWSDANDETPKTAAISIGEAMDVFQPIIEAGDEIVVFSISDSMSATRRVMQLAAEELEAEDRIHVVDSQNLSTGVGLQVIAAATMAEAGKSADEIVAALADITPRVRASFVVDTLTYLHRGGRCSSIAALAGGMLRLHPRIVVSEGKMDAGKKYRGKINRVIMEYVADMREDLLAAEKDRVFITHSGCDEETIAQVRAYLEELNVFDEILVTRAGSVISSHCGPGTLGVLFIAGK